MVVDVCLNIFARFVLQTFLKISDGGDILSIFVVGKSSSVVDNWVLLIGYESIRQITDSLFILIKFQVDSASKDQKLFISGLLFQRDVRVD